MTSIKISEKQKGTRQKIENPRIARVSEMICWLGGTIIELFHV